MRMRIAAGSALALLLMCALPAHTQTTSLELTRRVEQLRVHGSIAINGARIHATPLLLALYESRGNAPVWSAAAARELAAAIDASRDDGLEPAHYHAAALRQLERGSQTAAVAAELELLRSSALLRLQHDLRYGRTASQFPAAVPSATPAVAVAELTRAITSDRIVQFINGSRPQHFTYQRLVDVLRQLRRVAAAGGWHEIAAGTALRSGDTDARVPALRARLMIAGDLRAAPPRSDSVYDAVLTQAVRGFQHRHALNEDGVLGPATLREMNVPVEARIDQVRINLERARWITHALPHTFIAVNVAGGRVYFVREGSVIFEARAVVGRSYTRTPIFRAELQAIELNPTWTVPSSIIDEVLAAVRRDRNYLRAMDMRVLDRNGRTIAVSADRLAAMSASGFPYTLRQEPGPDNPLGQIKFLLPNRYNVYLHDTPAKSLFEQTDRTFSHGCIRVQDPLTLAVLVLNDATWSKAALQNAIATGATHRIELSASIPVLILYWTASADLHGELHFYRDVYGRDQAVLRALDVD